MIKNTFLLIVQFSLVSLDTPVTLNLFVVGGYNAGNDAFPYQVSIRRSNHHFCGGSIIGPKTILTAAHCIYGKNPAAITIVTGTTTLETGGTSYRARNLIPHPGFKHFPGSPDDIGLIKLYTPIRYSSKVGPIEISPSVVDTGVNAVLSGWGQRSFSNRRLPNNLQALNVETISQSKCEHLLYQPITAGEICTLPQFGKGACMGDSGGPLVSRGIQIGIVSWAIKCAQGFPDVYTRVSHYMKWILENSKQ